MFAAQFDGRGKYFDWGKMKLLDNNDICEYLRWISLPPLPHTQVKEYSLTVHPNGFKIFIAKDEMDVFDEYKDNDPYTFHMDDVFQKARVASTIHLLKTALGERKTFKLLDVGCGKGYITNQISINFPDSEISALDYSVSAINFAFKNFKGIDFIVADAYDLPYSKEYFDVVVCNNVWEHIPDPLNMLKLIKNVLKKGGYLIISTPSRYRMENIWRRLKGKPVRLMSTMHVTEYSITQVIEQLKYRNFKTLQVFAKKNYEVTGIKQFIFDAVIKQIIILFMKCIKYTPYSLESTCYYLSINE
jgi:ubiquinone/menaquinone biosynthesis C-methylase UbiE